MASMTSSSVRASEWMSSRSMGVTKVLLSRWMISCVRKSHLCSTSLISCALSSERGIGGEHLLEQPRAGADLVGHGHEVVVELLLAGNQTKICHARISSESARILYDCKRQPDFERRAAVDAVERADRAAV